jgi:hypothetical protein
MYRRRPPIYGPTILVDLPKPEPAAEQWVGVLGSHLYQ